MNLNIMIARGIIHDKTKNLLGSDPLSFELRTSLHTARRIRSIKDGWEVSNPFPLLIALEEIDETGLLKVSITTFIDRRLYEEI